MGPSSGLLIAMAPFSEILLLAIVGLFLLVALSVSGIVIRSLRCPHSGRGETVHFRTALWDGRFFDVKRCSAFRPGNAVTCPKTCLTSAPPNATGPITGLDSLNDLPSRPARKSHARP